MTSKLLEERYREALRELSVANKDNMMCADCMNKKKTSFVVLQFGSYICEMCADVHRTYGHRGVKQIGLSNFTKEEVEEMRQGGNQKVKASWYGGNYDQIVRPNPDLCGSDKEFKEKAKEHIKKVYIQRVYKSGTPNQSTQPQQQQQSINNNNNNTTIGSTNNQQAMPYNNVQYSNGGIDTRNRGASLNSTQYANMKTTNSSSIIQSSNISGVNSVKSGSNSGNNNSTLPSSSEDLMSFGGSTPSQPTMNVLNGFNQPQPSYGQPQPSYNNSNNNYYPPNNNNNSNYNQGMNNNNYNNMQQYGNQPPPMNNNMGYGYNNNNNNYNNMPMMNNNMSMMNNNYNNNNYNNNSYGYNNNNNNGGMMNNNNNNMMNNYGYGQPQQPQYNMNNNFNNQGMNNNNYNNMQYGNVQPPMNNNNGGSNRPPQTSPPPSGSNYGMTPNVNTRQSTTPNNPMGYNNQYGTPMTPSQPSQSSITPVNPYVSSTNQPPKSNIPSVPTNVPQPPLNVSSTQNRSASMPPKTTPPSMVATPPKQPVVQQPIVQPMSSTSSIQLPKKDAGQKGIDNLSNQLNNMSLSSNVKPSSTTTVPKSTPPLSFGSSTTSTTANTTQKPPQGVTANTGLLVGSTKKIDSSEFEQANSTGVHMDDLRGNASKDNTKFKEINPNRVIPMKQTTDWQ